MSFAATRAGASANPWLNAVLVALATFMARHHDRQCRTALHRRWPGGQRGRGVMGGDHLSGRQRRQSDGKRVSGLSDRPQGLLPDLSGAVHRELGAVRHCLDSAVAAAVPHHAGLGRRRHGAGRHVDSGGCIPAREARPGHRGVRGCCRRRPGSRADSRGLAVRQCLLALVLSGQWSGRCDHDRASRARLRGGGRGAAEVAQAKAGSTLSASRWSRPSSAPWRSCSIAGSRTTGSARLL